MLDRWLTVQRAIFLFACCVLLMRSLLAPASALAQDKKASEEVGRAVAIVKQYCLDCHGREKPEGDLDLSAFTTTSDMIGKRHAWDKIKQRVHLGDMPPKNSEPVPVEDRQWIVGWISKVFREEACGAGVQSGPAPLRRLNRDQYGNTLRDLLGVGFDAGHELPADGAGGEGFDNAAETLFLSPMHGEKYLAAAKEALEYVSRDESARKRLFIARPSDTLSAEKAAQQIIHAFASRAFRRPIDSEQLARLMAIYEAAVKDGAAFDDAVLYTLQAVLISPHFLFMVEPHNDSEEPKPVDSYAMASRLSYFLWDTMPDRELRELADKGELVTDAQLDAQVERMLKQERLHEMCEAFVGQWLQTRELGRTVKPDPELYPRVIDEVLDAYREEPVRLFEYVLRENRSLLELIDCDYTFLNDDLVRVYGISRKDLEGELKQHVKRFKLPEASPRGGLMTMAGVLTVSSYPNRTSPVLRGKWLLETILGDPPPAPPPGVPPLSDKDQDKTGKTLRQRLEIHRADATCAACHDRLDPLGFALENFDPIGKWRDKDNGVPVDSTGELPAV